MKLIDSIGLGNIDYEEDDEYDQEDINTGTALHEVNPSYKYKYLKDTQTLLDVFKEYGNPFTKGPPDQLLHIIWITFLKPSLIKKKTQT